MSRPSPARVFEALGDPVRRAILQLVAGGERSAGALVEEIRGHTPISQPAVSQHLKVLREAGLVRVRSEANRRFYALDPDGPAAAREWLAELVDPLAGFAQPLDALATEVARGKRERRGKNTGTGADRTNRTA
ncbi:metalloregulator ArsR/SmtB family transcription factor [Nocardia sp. NPDC004568]|uniref:ArsR/SmtB family transcription factor n=1 Tax=Nocardia sp. NPDC004568 TaxID=3154551 RepID=UPI0033B68581